MCEGRCGHVWEKAVEDSNDFGEGHWIGSCGLDEAERLSRGEAKSPVTHPAYHSLARFVTAQADTYAHALNEIRVGRKHTHWMWFVFPQLQGLGTSSTSRFYAIRDRAEAEAYLAHPVLGPRLREITEAVLAVDGKSASEILGSPDDLKLRSCATLFASVSAPGSLFEGVLEKFYGGKPDPETLRRLGAR